METEQERVGRVVFEDIKFSRKDVETVRGLFLGRYWFDLRDEELIDGARRGTLTQLADWTAEADKVLVF